jgi:hypothetical protein
VTTVRGRSTGIRRFAKANVRIGMAVAEHGRRPAWNEGDFFGARFGRQRIGNAE